VQRPDGSLFLADLKQKLLLPQNEANVAGTRYNVSLVNSLVLYVGMQVSYGTRHLLTLFCSVHCTVLIVLYSEIVNQHQQKRG
jgi:hypothetical protein